MADYELKRSAFFAEYAEAIGITTMDIFAALEDYGKAFVFYIEGDNNDDAFLAVLRRGEDGILVPTGPPMLQPGLLKDARAQTEERLRYELGLPPGKEDEDEDPQG